MNKKSVLLVSVAFVICSCGGGGGSGGDATTPTTNNAPTTTTPPTTQQPEPNPKHLMPTGFVEGEGLTDDMDADGNDVERYYLPGVIIGHEDGNLIAFVPAYGSDIDDLEYVNNVKLYTYAWYDPLEKVRDIAFFDPFNLDQKTYTVQGGNVYGFGFEGTYEGEFIGIPDFNSLALVGIDAGDNPFAVANFWDRRDVATEVPVDSTSPITLNGIEYGYQYLDTETGDITRVANDDGTINIDGSSINGDFNGGEITFAGDLSGRDINNGTSSLTLDGQEYPGDVKGYIGVDNTNPIPATVTGGAFVSNDKTDEVLYSGGWYGNISD